MFRHRLIDKTQFQYVGLAAGAFLLSITSLLIPGRGTQGSIRAPWFFITLFVPSSTIELPTHRFCSYSGVRVVYHPIDIPEHRRPSPASVPASWYPIGHRGISAMVEAQDDWLVGSIHSLEVWKEASMTWIWCDNWCFAPVFRGHPLTGCRNRV